MSENTKNVNEIIKPEDSCHRHLIEDWLTEETLTENTVSALDKAIQACEQYHPKETEEAPEKKEEEDKNFSELMSALDGLIGCFSKSSDSLEEKVKNHEATAYLEITQNNLNEEYKNRNYSFEKNKTDIYTYSTEFEGYIGKHNIDEIYVFPSEKLIIIDGNLNENLSGLEDMLSAKKTLMITGTVKESNEKFKALKSLRRKDFMIVSDIQAAKDFLDSLDKAEVIYVANMEDDIYKEIVNAAKLKEKAYMAKKMRKVHMKGDIIITDPCYVAKERDTSNQPKWDDYFEYKSLYEYPDYTKNSGSPTFNKHQKAYDAAYKEWEKTHPDTRELFLNYPERFGVKTYIMSRTGVGDWSCETLNSDTKEILGEFCADSGEVAVFLLDEILAYNPEFDCHLTRNWTTTLIKNFDGEVCFNPVKDDNGFYLSVKGTGNINFETRMSE